MKETFENQLKEDDTLFGLSYKAFSDAEKGRLILNVEENVWVIEKDVPPPPPPPDGKSSRPWIIFILLLVLGVGAAGYFLWPDWYNSLQALWSEPESDQAATPPGSDPQPTPSPGASCPESPQQGLAEALEHLNSAHDSTDSSEKALSYDSARVILRCNINACLLYTSDAADD